MENGIPERYLVSDREERATDFGAIPLSPDILSNANIGLWAFELDEDAEPRMYADLAMRRLLGIERPCTPEETYHAWYDHIDEGSYALVEDAVEKMKVAHAEVQYPWHHPNGSTMIVRCGGVRNPEYTKGLRIEGTHQNVTEVLHFDEKEAERFKQAEIRLRHELLRSEVLNYMINNDDDPIELLKNYAEQLRVLMNCDQVIYRDLEETRIMVNSPAIEKTWAVPIEYCRQCEHFDAHHPMYAGGYTEMDDCQEGWQGIPVYHDCPIKSSLTRIVRCDGEIAGYLAIHFVQKYHHFTDIERATLEEFTRILSISLSRYAYKQKSSELDDIKQAMEMISAQREKIEKQQHQLEEALSMAQAANRAKTVFLNNMSHDIRTPMNAIIGYTGLAISHMDDREHVKDYLSKIEESSDHLLSLINDILDMSRIESGNVQIEESAESISEIVATLQDIIQPDANNRHQTLTIDKSGVHSDLVICDKLRLNQVLLNVLSNAVKYTPDEGSISLTVSEKEMDRSGYSSFIFVVKDNGMGMDEEFMKTIYDPFTRVRSSTVSGIQGTGLGMAITKNLMDIMGGTIDIKSEPHHGTEVSMKFVFKLQTESEQAAYAASCSSADPDEEQYDFTGKKILLVEDNPLNREIATDVLTEAGFIVSLAEDGDIAVEMMRHAEAGDYDLILMDVQMPTINGYEATRQIRALGTDISRIPILAMTANAFEEDRKAALEAGMNEHIPKPINIKKFKKMLVKFL